MFAMGGKPTLAFGATRPLRSEQRHWPNSSRKMRRSSLVSAIMLVCSSCVDFPADPESTLQRVKSEQIFRVGLITSTNPIGSDPNVQALLENVGRTVGASSQAIEGDADVLLTQLKNGELDLVVGRFQKKSPWSRLVTIGPPLRTMRHAGVEFVLAPVARNGENGWIAVIEREAREISTEAQ